jgi:hypothetical protein
MIRKEIFNSRQIKLLLHLLQIIIHELFNKTENL